MRLEIMQRDNWTCACCRATDSTLNVHHRWYTRGSEPWEYPPEALVTLCEQCHERERTWRDAPLEKLDTALKERLLYRDLGWISLMFDDVPLNAMREYCEAVSCYPWDELIASWRERHARINAGPAPITERPPHERDAYVMR